LIYPTVWPQYTNVTERQTDRQTHRQQCDSTGQAVVQTVTQKSVSMGDSVNEVSREGGRQSMWKWFIKQVSF